MQYKLTSDNIKKHYSEVFGYLREARSFVLLAVGIFLIGILIGLLYPSQGEELLSGLKTMARHLKGKDILSISAAIFLKNSLASAISVFLGPLLGIVPVLGDIGNGVIMGTLLSHMGETNKIKVLLQLIPHGIFELPAIFIAWGVGIWQGTWVFHRGPETFRERRRKSIRIFLMIILPLLVVAAIIEGTNIYLATK